MPSLICNVKNCSHNQDSYCCLSGIEVGGNTATNLTQTCCENFCQDAYTNSNCAKEIQEVVDVTCNAERCIHNEGYHCTAECVPIAGLSSACCSTQDTLCGAFVSK